jgi:hypothetical protein
VDEFKRTEDVLQRTREEEFIERCLAAKAWRLSQLNDTRTSDLIKHFSVLHSTPTFAMPIEHATAFTRKIVAECAAEQNYTRWVEALNPGTISLAAWHCTDAARFPAFEDLPEDEFEMYKTTWLEAALCNGLLKTFDDVRKGDASSFLKFSSLWLDLDGMVEMEDSSARRVDLLAAFNKFIMGMHVVLDPTPRAFGTAPEDAHYIWPLKDSKGEVGKSFADESPLARTVVRHISKNNIIMDMVSDLKKHGGAEAQLGSDWYDMTQQCLHLSVSVREASSAEDCAAKVVQQRKALEDFITMRPDGLRRLRKNATVEVDRIVCKAANAIWKFVEEDPGIAEEMMQILAPVCKALPDLSALEASISDRQAEKVQAERQEGMESAFSATSIDSMEACNGLMGTLRKNATVPKTDKQLASMQSLISKVQEFLVERLQDLPGPEAP